MNSNTKVESIVYIVIGGLAFIFSLVCFFSDTGTFESLSSYGGDAYTGIQNAGALTANNVRCVARICSFGFGAILLLAGAMILSKGIFSLIAASKKSHDRLAAPQPETRIPAESPEQLAGAPSAPENVPVPTASVVQQGEQPCVR